MPQSSNTYTITFIVILSFICAAILASLASALKEPQEIAVDLDRSKQMMIAAHLMDHQEHFLLPDGKGGFIPAKVEEDNKLVPGTANDFPTSKQILAIYKKRIIPLLVDEKGKLVTFEEAKIDKTRYLEENKKTGYYKQPYKLIYKILPNEGDQPIGYVIPVNGFGLWDAIYGYLAIGIDGNTIIGTTWYKQAETPGLGANIADEPWQMNFPGKKIFQENANGTTDIATAPLGITVVRGKVSEVLSGSPKAKSAVDGMAGATLTGNGVTSAYKDVLAAYRPFLVHLYEQANKKS